MAYIIKLQFRPLFNGELYLAQAIIHDGCGSGPYCHGVGMGDGPKAEFYRMAPRRDVELDETIAELCGPTDIASIQINICQQRRHEDLQGGGGGRRRYWLHDNGRAIDDWRGRVDD